ncbi:peptidylprolyl isomerase [Sneathiella limimaris]|uniref:peptidylprolyl isomerase n=1 Tax=Sneathiella limimaris TaxID=1964213 RepID=UPI001469A437|nr:peptidylprolyl isomerase [Sneathiella limimaris]
MKVSNLLAVIVVAGAAGGLGFYLGGERPWEGKTEPKAEMTAATQTAKEASDSPVVATVNGVEIREDEVREVYEGLPAQYKQAPYQFLKAQLVEQLVSMKVVQSAALDQKYDQQAEFTDRVDDVKLQLLQEYFLQKKIEEAVTDEAVKAEYDKTTADFQPEKEVHARHILLEEEDKAKDIITQLNEGGDFQALAKEHSTGPSGPNGGDLGYFVKGRMVPEFSEAAFAMEKGAHSTEPVKTQFGWHVILVEDIRDTQPPSYEEMEGQLRQTLSSQTVTTLLEDLKSKAVIDIVEKKPEAEAPASSEAEEKKE